MGRLIVLVIVLALVFTSPQIMNCMGTAIGALVLFSLLSVKMKSGRD